MSAFEPYKGTEPYIFVSYSRKDKDRVFPVVEALANAGFRIWRDEGGIPLGTAWMATIQDHIMRAEACLVFWSASSAASPHCQAETGEMVAEQKPIVTVYLDDTPITIGLEMYLRRFQSVKLDEFADADAFAARLGQEEAFVRCRMGAPSAPALTVEWERSGQIQWYLDRKGVLTIAKAADLRSMETVPIPDFQEKRAGSRLSKSDLVFLKAVKAYRALRSSYPQADDEPKDDEPENAAPWMDFQDEIRSITIWNDIDTIGEYAFHGCKGLKSVTIGDHVSAIRDSAFSQCVRLTSVKIGDRVTAIGRSAFSDCWDLTSVTIPDSVTTIGALAFSGIHEQIVDRLDDTLYGRMCLTSVKIGRGLGSGIGVETFSGCAGLAAIEVDRDNEAYSSRDGVLFDKAGTALICYPMGRAGETYTVPDGVTTIGSMAFGGCTRLTCVQIPASVTAISDIAFVPSGLLIVSLGTDRSSVSAIEVDRDNDVYSSRDGVLFDKAGTTLIRYPMEKPGTAYTIPDGVTSIGECAFWGCRYLRNVKIPDSVTSIGEYAFYGCQDLRNVTIPDGVTSIGDFAFRQCYSLASVTIPDSVTSIGDDVFSRLGLKSISIPAGAVLNEDAFHGVRIVRRPPHGDAPWWMFWKR